MSLSLNPRLASRRNEDYVDLVYRAVLGRNVDPTGLANFVSALAAGRPRSLVLRKTRDSNEGKKRPQGPQAASKAIATLLSVTAARLLTPVFAESLARGGKDREDALWAIIERDVDASAHFLSEAGERLLLSDCPGWLEEFRNDEISGFLFGREAREVHVYVNGTFVASARSEVAHPELCAAGIDATMFHLPFSAGRLSDSGMSTMSALTEGRNLWPEDRLTSREHSLLAPVIQEPAGPKKLRSPGVDEAGFPDGHPAPDSDRAEPLAVADGNLLTFLLAQHDLRAALTASTVVELRASDDENRTAILPAATRVEINCSNAAEAQAAVRRLSDVASSILIHNTLQFLSETRQFLGLCFSKLSVGGMMIVTVPHQFLFERKLRLPSRRNRHHRRFYTPNTLLRDIEEAIDPCECRVRFLGENDAGYDYRADLNSDPAGGQDIVVALERIAPPVWRAELDSDELWAEDPERPSRIPEIGEGEAGQTCIVAPDPHPIKRVILVKLDHRGDFIMAREAFKIFRSTFSEAEITLVCGPWNVAEAEASGYFDRVLPFAFFPEDDSARSVTPAREDLIKSFARQIAGETYDLAVDLRLFDDSRPVLQAIKARDRAGFDRYESFPWLTIRLNAPSPTEDGRAEEYVIPASRFRTSIGAHRTFEIRCETNGPAKGEAVIWGPFDHLGPGRYQFECLIEPLGGDFDMAFDVVSDQTKRAVAEGKVSAAGKDFPLLHFRLLDTAEKLEFRLRGDGQELKPFRFLGLRVTRLGLEQGLHQSEAMALLAHLVHLRTATPFTVQRR